MWNAIKGIGCATALAIVAFVLGVFVLAPIAKMLGF